MDRKNLMALEQINFRLPRWMKRQLKDFAENESLTLEGFLQTLVQEYFDEHIDDLEEEIEVKRDYTAEARSRLKYGQDAA